MFEAYSVAVRVSLINNVTSGLMGISQAFAKVHGDAKALRKELDGIRLLMLSGAAVGGVGFLGLSAIAKTIDPAKEYARQLSLMNAAGMEHAEVVKSINAAWALNKTVRTSTTTQNLEAIRELRTVFGSTDEAINFLPVSQRLDAILRTVRGSGSDPKGEIQGMARALDLRNATTDRRTAYEQANLMTQAIVASGGVLTAKDFASTFKYGRTATLGWSNEFAYRVLPSLMQELKSGGGAGAGGGPGNPLMSAYAAVVQGTVPQKALSVWNTLGLLDQSKVVWTKAGEAKGLKPGAITGSDLFISDPYMWTRTVLQPALIRAGYDTEKQQRQVLGYLFPNRTAGAVMSTMLFQQRAIDRDRKMFGIAKGLDAYEQMVKDNPQMADMALAAQWKNLLTVIGYEILPVLVSGTLKVIDGLQGLTQWMREHPRITRALVWSFVGLSGAMAFSGTVMLLAGGFRAVGLALRVMGVAKLFTVAQGLTSVAGGATAAAPALGTLAASIGGFLAVLGAVALPAGLAVAGALWERRRDQEILNDPSAASPIARAALRKKLESERNVRDFFGVSSSPVVDMLEKLRRGSTPARGGRAPVAGAPDPFASFAGLGQGPASPFVRAAPAGAMPAPNFTLNMDGRKVGEIVSGHQAREMGARRVVGGRHDPSATPASPGGVQR